ncbi:interleukin-11 receptor subunit alpha isoform X2 [Zootoca vivipara]|nr:interleukin-11 receptor subunit alpha isoform X2 [Zootoca vivipara]XP_060136390.1 interleukin-11 receptor subunit alpha isoform X2 [Zootoca vivipara]XP_060136391.1 interleukin-11 receptor subunit alpha isoform X2 [Zootoca vivipara]
MLTLVSCVGRVVVLLAAVSVTTSIMMSGEWGEEGVTYAQLGKDVILTCAGASPGSSVEWRWNGGTILPEDSAIQAGQLLLSHTQLSSKGVFSCHDTSGVLLSSTVLRLGRLPGRPSILCTASNYVNVSCFWDSTVETFLPTRYITSYRSGSVNAEADKQRSPQGPCIQDPAKPFSCTIHDSMFWKGLWVNVTEVNPLGSNFRLLNIVMQGIIKPDPPEHLQVEPVPSAPSRLQVSWEYPSSWTMASHFELKFRLRYRPVTSTSWSMVETVNVSEVITDALLGLLHVVQVSAKDFMDAGSWSEWTPEAWATPATGQTLVPSETATAAIKPESPAEEPSLAPNNGPIGHSDPTEKVAVLVSLGVFAFFVLAVILVFAFLMWVRMKKHSKEATKNHDLLAAAIHMKALPKAQIL